MPDNPAPQEVADGISRRRMLQVLGIGTLAAVSGAGVYALVSSGDDEEPVDLTKLSAAEQSIYRIGRHYLDAHPGNASNDALIATLTASGAGSVVATVRHDPAAAVRSLRGHSCVDYARGRVVEVDGWQLSHCEASAAALYALSLG